MKPDVVRCACCGLMVLRRELDEFLNGPCCPSSTRKPRSDKGTHKTAPDGDVQFKLAVEGEL
jgi:hypothetical protein